ncbi:MAG: cupin domain-containing protein [Dietzia psychralcaliphila]
MTEQSLSTGSVLHPGEGTSYWFMGSLVTVKVGGAQTRNRLTVIDFLNPAGFTPPLHRHLKEDECFYVLSGSARFRCDDQTFEAHEGDVVFLPVGSAHSFKVLGDEPLRTLQITVPAGFEEFADEAGEPAQEAVLPAPGPVDEEAMTAAAARHDIEILGPPPADL